ncbi:MAG: dockerin type I repeat-containing protein, partial [Clostridia bacterium]|nr:dockerin type I repeat-containing protein [Clostridia bacterium]
VTADARQAIEDARAAFDALTPLQKALVNGLEKLEKAEKALAKLPVGSVRGDVDGDGKTSAADALEVLKFVVGKVQLTDEQKVAANLNGDSGIGADDALVILRIVVGKE